MSLDLLRGGCCCFLARCSLCIGIKRSSISVSGRSKDPSSLPVGAEDDGSLISEWCVTLQFWTEFTNDAIGYMNICERTKQYRVLSPLANYAVYINIRLLDTKSEGLDREYIFSSPIHPPERRR